MSPSDWSAAVALVRLSASARNSLGSSAMAALYPPSACSGVSARPVTPAAQRRQLAEPRDQGVDGLRLVGRLAAHGAWGVHCRQKRRLVGIGCLGGRVVGRQVGRGRLGQVDHRGGALVLQQAGELGRRQRGRVDQAGRPVQVDGVIDRGADHIGEQPDHGDERDRHEEVNPEPDGPAARSHGTPTFSEASVAWPPIASSYGQDGQNSP